MARTKSAIKGKARRVRFLAPGPIQHANMDEETRNVPRDQLLEAPLPVENDNNGSLFRMLSPDLLRIIFQYIGPDDMKSYVRLAISGDQVLERFIYIECTHLWKHLDLAKFPRITDAQLESLLERIHAVHVVESIVFDKSARRLRGTGLEPLRHSRVLKRIDLRQKDSLQPGPTFLNDRFVTDVLSTMMPHKLEMVKVRKQFRNEPDEYCLAWGAFFATEKLNNARKFAVGYTEFNRCSHCRHRLAPFNPPLTAQEVLQANPIRCTLCDKYSCRSWKRRSSCPPILECGRCLERCCCRLVLTCGSCNSNSCVECDPDYLTCPQCGVNSCSGCKQVKRCKECLVTACRDCRDDINTCARCKNTFCDECDDVDFCSVCKQWRCTDCGFRTCECCYKTVCNDCQEDVRVAPMDKTFWCEGCGCHLCIACTYKEGHYECSVCGNSWCHDCLNIFENHDCEPPGELVYSSRNAMEFDERESLCDCGKKHLTNAKGQQFMCSWAHQVNAKRRRRA